MQWSYPDYNSFPKAHVQVPSKSVEIIIRRVQGLVFTLEFLKA